MHKFQSNCQLLSSTFLPYPLLFGIALLFLAAFPQSVRAQNCSPNYITLTTQTQVDNFQMLYGPCSDVVGDLTIQGTGITNLAGLSSLTSVGGSLSLVNSNLTNINELANLTSLGALQIINNGNLTNIDGLSGITSILGILYIINNSSLTNIDGLSNLSSDGYYFLIKDNSSLANVDGLASMSFIVILEIVNNASLTSLNGLSNITSIGGGGLIINSNDNLTNVDGLSGIPSIGGSLRIFDNGSLANLNGLSSLTTIGSFVYIFGNSSLTNLDGLSNLTSVGTYLDISGNDILTDCCGIHDLLNTPGAITGTITINNNDTGCDSETEINNYCDADGDGVNIADGDCDDTDPNNFPGNTEVCDGQDNNCDTMVDEGLAGETYMGNVNLSTQAEIDAWPACFTSISGSLSIGGVGTDITDLSPLAVLSSIGSLTISHTNVTSLDAFSNITSLSGQLSISNNDMISNLDGLSNLMYVGSNLAIQHNNLLNNIDGLSNLTSIGGVGGGYLNILNNENLANLDGLSNISSVSHFVQIVGNDIILNLDGLSSLTSVGQNFSVFSNTSLTNCCGIHDLLNTSGAIAGTINISNNDTGCDSETEIDTYCAFAAGDIIITEIMQNPAAVNDSEGEWFEVYNTTSSPIDMNGMVITDNGSQSFTINAGGPLLIQPSGFLVFAENGNVGTNGGVVANYDYPSTFTLTNTADAISIQTSIGFVIDQVAYDGGPNFPNPNGASMSLNPTKFDPIQNDNGANWCEATSAFGDGDLGTPGAANDAFNTYYVDGDGDNYGDSDNSITTCDPSPPSGYAAQGGDCNDGDPAINPGAAELPCDGIDNNCNTNIDENRQDADGDTFDECVDCDDNDPSINPAATEICDGVDNNCNNLIDNADPMLVDNTDPFIICPGNKTINANASCGGTVGWWHAVVATDNCGPVTVIQSPSPTTPLNGHNDSETVTLTVNDLNGNTADCSFTVTLIDNADPSITCPGNQTISTTNIMDCDEPIGNWVNSASASDNCGSVIVSQSPPSSTILNGHDDFETVTLTADDGNGNTANCSFTVTLKDNTPPYWTAFPVTVSIPIYANENCEAELPDYRIAYPLEAIDACGGTITYTQSPAPGTIISGPIEVTLTAEDERGNIASGSFMTPELIDNTPPSITCPGTQTVQADLSGNYSMENFTGLASASDNCTASPVKTQSPPVGATLGIGNHTVTVTATDDGNLTANCTFTLTVQAGCSTPIVSCPVTQTVAADGSCGGTLNDYIGSASVSGGCGIITLTQSPIAGTALSLGTISVTITATDESNNTSSCSFDVTLEDQTDPTITCPPNQTVLANGNCEGTVGTWAAATLGDNCGTPTVSQSPTAATVLSGHNDMETVTLTADDGNGNTADCSFTVTLIDNTDPSITCPGNQTVNANASCEGTVGTWAAASLDDNCGTPIVSQSPAAATVLSGHNDMETVTLTADDGNGNTANCSFTITLLDDTDPTITCPPNQTILANGSCEGTVGTWAAATLDDNCGTPTVSQSPTAATVLSGHNDMETVTLTADDGHGNTANCSFNVTLIDDTDPTITCPPNQTILANGSCEGTVGTWAAATLDDNCGTPTVFQSPSAATVLSGLNDMETITLTADDGNGNTANCSFTITLLDNTPPVPSCETSTVELDANGEYTLQESDVFDAVNSFDNCGTITFVSMDISTVSCTDVWSSPVSVVVTATDGNGNYADCTANVTVEDNTLPIPVCKTTTIQLDASGNYLLTQNDVFDGGADNCTAVNFWKMNPTTVSCANAGTTVPVTVDVFDGSGNQASCIADITVWDSEAPIAICPSNIPDVILDANGNGQLPANIGDGNSTDNCEVIETSPNMNFTCADVGMQMVTLTASDGTNSNSVNCTFKVMDNISPTAICPANIPDVMLDANGNGQLPANIGDGSSTDNCGVTETNPNMNFTCADVGPQTVILTADDGHGGTSTATCSFNVVDNTSPDAVCTTQTIVVNLDANGSYTIDPNDLDNGSSDVCGSVSLSASPATLDCQDEGINTITLTVTDANGNSNTCTATIEVLEYLTINNIATTNEICEGSGDGTIIITASSGGGQIGYSIDGGVSYQFSGMFSNLSAGNYNITVKVFGIPDICEKTATATVNGGSPATTWYKDADGDGYTDGNTQTSCSQPSGYIAAPLPGTDCNDYDPSVFPGQIWYKDADNDGYTDGITQASCSRPSGFKTSAELVNATEMDCNDNDSAVNHGALEICNGIDDNCDGQIDEGTSGGLTWTGNVVFSTQADVDSWSSCYTVIDGHLLIQGASINDLSNLENLVEVTGNLTIQSTGLEDMVGLDGLTEIGGTLSIYFNSSLTTLDGLDLLATVSGSLTIYYNFQLSNCCAIYSLINGGVAGPIVIFFNKVGCNNVTEINNICNPSQSVSSNPNSNHSASSDPSISHKSSLTENQIEVFPNPNSGQFSIRFRDAVSTGEITLYNTNGQALLQMDIEAGSSRVEVTLKEKMTPGIYLLRIRNGHEILSKKVIVQ